jgi:hypothetical protein
MTTMLADLYASVVAPNFAGPEGFTEDLSDGCDLGLM